MTAALKAKQPLCDLKYVISSGHNGLLGHLNCPKTYLVGISVQYLVSGVGDLSVNYRNVLLLNS